MPSLRWQSDDRVSRADLIKDYGSTITNAAYKLVARYLTHERQITEAMQSALPEGTYLDGPEHRIKSPYSTARKIRLKAMAGRSVEDAAESLNDVARFFIVAPDEQLLAAANEAVDNLVPQGWRVESAEHTFVEPNRYKGAAAILRHDNGLKMELSFHTPLSSAVKRATHPAYDIIRDPFQEKSLRAEWFKFETDLCSAIPTPPGFGEHDHPMLQGLPLEPKVYPAPSEDQLTQLRDFLGGSVFDQPKPERMQALELVRSDYQKLGASAAVQRLMDRREGAGR